VKIIEKYARFLSKYPYVILAIMIVLTGFLANYAKQVQTKSMTYKNMMPKNIEVVNTLYKLGDEFGISSSNVIIVVKDKNVLSPADLRYQYTLGKKLESVPGVLYVDDIAFKMAEANNGSLPTNQGDINYVLSKGITMNVNPPNVYNVLQKMENETEKMEKGNQKIGENLENLSASLGNLSLMLKGLGIMMESMGNEMANGEKISPEKFDSLLNAVTMVNESIYYSPLPVMEKIQLIYALNGIKAGISGLISGLEYSEKNTIALGNMLKSTGIMLESIGNGLSKMAYGMNEMSSAVKMMNEGYSGLEKGFSAVKMLLSKFYGVKNEKPKKVEIDITTGLVNDEKTVALIRLRTADMSEDQRTELIKEIKNVIANTPAPPTANVGLTGSEAIYMEMREQVKPIMQKTSMISFIGILITVCLLFYSIRHGLLSLTGILFGVIWVYGIFGLFHISMSPQTSGALSMIMGVGIDFGIQVVNRFRQEAREKDLEKSMEIAVSKTFFPMLITTLSALIGFRAMSLGRVTVLKALGNMMSLGILTCFIAAITVVPSTTLLVDKAWEKIKTKI